MLTQIVVFILGLGILYLGADWLIDGASEVARKFGIRPLIIGLTIVALGTSLPEFLLNLFAVAAEEDGLAIGNIIGSNIANLGASVIQKFQQANQTNDRIVISATGVENHQ